MLTIALAVGVALLFGGWIVAIVASSPPAAYLGTIMAGIGIATLASAGVGYLIG